MTGEPKCSHVHWILSGLTNPCLFFNRNHPPIKRLDSPLQPSLPTHTTSEGIVGTAVRWEMERGIVGEREGALWVFRSLSATGIRPPCPVRVPGVQQYSTGYGTHWQPIVLHHFIKLLVNFFVFLLCAGGEGEGLLRVWALRVPVLFLVQSLHSHKGGRKGERETERKRERERERERGND